MQGEHNAKHNANTMQPNANNCLANALYMVSAYIYMACAFRGRSSWLYFEENEENTQ
jgi:hypothetical protein